MRYGIYDCETKSALDLPQFGSHNYARDPSTDIWFVSFCIVTDGVPGPVLTWQPGEPPPAEIINLHADPEGLIAAFPDAFERQIEQNILGPRYGWPVLPPVKLGRVLARARLARLRQFLHRRFALLGLAYGELQCRGAHRWCHQRAS